ncbi:DUF2750 domain-containing protein [Streptomyces sp. NBC_00885]|uniref:DUF2750 domain-containing protein n=1 Tax=Streptomyces sp. NBC_00885 TaxID=2975857 RepID=UPI003870A4B8
MLSKSFAQAAAFFRDVRATEKVWFIRNGDGCPAPLGANGRRSLPFWSSAARAARAACRLGFEPVGGVDAVGCLA